MLTLTPSLSLRRGGLGEGWGEGWNPDQNLNLRDQDFIRRLLVLSAQNLNLPSILIGIPVCGGA